MSNQLSGEQSLLTIAGATPKISERNQTIDFFISTQQTNEKREPPPLHCQKLLKPIKSQSNLIALKSTSQMINFLQKEHSQKHYLPVAQQFIKKQRGNI